MDDYQLLALWGVNPTSTDSAEADPGGEDGCGV
jgi:hypothetical protein